MLDLLYAGAARWRRRVVERHPERRRRLARPVISIGNLSAGGTGKTPVVEALARWLVANGERPAILSRGYKRRDVMPGVVVVSDGRQVLADVHRSGDEPLMLARAVPGTRVCVAEDRFVAGALAEHHLDATVHLLDDGFQHLELARDFDVVVTTPGEIAQGRVLPLGRLREPAETVQRADLLLVMGADATAAAAEAAALGVREAGGVIRRVGPPQPVPGSASQPEPGAPLLVAGIANPDRFAENVRAAGWAVAGEAWFPDHHPFTAQDIARIDQQRRASGAGAVFTTAKDAVRFEPLGTLPFALYEVALAIEFDPPSLLFERVAQVISTRRRLEADLARVEVYGRLEPSPAHTPHAASRGDA